MIKNKLFISFVFCFFIFPFTASANSLLTREQAVSILINQVITPVADEEFCMAFGPQDILPVGVIVSPPFDDALPYKSTSRAIQKPTWFFWVDTNKWAKFVHLSYFVYIDATHSNPTIGDGIICDEQGWWPRINGVHYLKNSTERLNTSDIVFGTPPSDPPTRRPIINPIKSKE